MIWPEDRARFDSRHDFLITSYLTNDEFWWEIQTRLQIRFRHKILCKKWLILVIEAALKTSHGFYRIKRNSMQQGGPGHLMFPQSSTQPKPWSWAAAGKCPIDSNRTHKAQCPRHRSFTNQNGAILAPRCCQDSNYWNKIPQNAPQNELWTNPCCAKQQ